MSARILPKTKTGVLAVALFVAAASLLHAGDRAAWMKQAKWGVMNHYLAELQGKVHNLTMSVDEWNKLIDNFDTEALAEQLHYVHAAYYQISIGQNSGYYLSPNPVYDKLTGIRPSKCSRRDLIADLYESLQKRGIRLMVYLPSGAPDEDQAAETALEWRKGPYPNREFQLKWQQIVRYWSEHWGNKVSGWWFDGCYYPNSMYRSAKAPNFASLAAAARAGNPDAVVAFNPGVYYKISGMSPHQDFMAGEIDKPELVELGRSTGGKLDGVQIHMLSYLGQKWGQGTPRFTNEQAVSFSKQIWDDGGAVTWDVPVQLNGTLPDAFLGQLRAIGNAANGANGH